LFVRKVVVPIRLPVIGLELLKVQTKRKLQKAQTEPWVASIFGKTLKSAHQVIKVSYNFYYNKTHFKIPHFFAIIVGMIKAVLFDIDGVLLDSFEANYQFYSDMMDHFGYPMLDKKEVQSMFHMTMVESIQHITKAPDDKVLKILEFAKNLDVQHHLLKTPENYEKIIDNLSKSYDLGIVTSKRNINIFKAPQMKNIEKHFKAVVGFNDVANHKPHPESLLLALEKLGVSPDEAVYIGDMHTDVAAAKAAGMKMILFAREPLPDADATTYSFLELPDLIKKL